VHKFNWRLVIPGPDVKNIILLEMFPVVFPTDTVPLDTTDDKTKNPFKQQ
jgi:hypothetical protein